MLQFRLVGYLNSQAVHAAYFRGRVREPLKSVARRLARYYQDSMRLVRSTTTAAWKWGVVDRSRDESLTVRRNENLCTSRRFFARLSSVPRDGRSRPGAAHRPNVLSFYTMVDGSKDALQAW
jgi:hypothetical protein